MLVQILKQSTLTVTFLIVIPILTFNFHQYSTHNILTLSHVSPNFEVF